MPVEGFDVSFFKKSIYKFFNRLAERNFGIFIVVSKALQNTLICYHNVNSKKIELIYNCVEFLKKAGKAVDIRNKYGLEGRVLIGSAGRLAGQKGFTYLIDAVEIIVNKRKDLSNNLTFVIGGDGELKKSLVGKVEKIGLGKFFIFPGFIEDIKSFLDELDIFVMPSLLEGQPIALLEAMSMQKPVIATDIDGINETIINSEDGLLVKPKNSSDLAEKIILLLDDKKLSAKLGKNAKKTVDERYNLEIFIEKHKRVYENIYKCLISR
jgi:glycosyltransferase involved in cell wall biosynthesis